MYDWVESHYGKQGVEEGAGEQWMIWQDFRKKDGRGQLVPYPNHPRRLFNTKEQAIQWITAMNPNWRKENNVVIDTIEDNEVDDEVDDDQMAAIKALVTEYMDDCGYTKVNQLKISWSSMPF